MAERQYSLFEKKGHIAYITINRPDVMNAINAATTQELASAFAEFEADDDLWVAIYTGAGDRAFSAGMDLRASAEASASGARPQTGHPGGMAGLTNPRTYLSKPLIAAVNGYALGGGFEMAMACDIVIAAETAQFGLPEVTRGIIAGAGGVHRLPRQMPMKIAMGYMLTGKRMTAAEAHKWGLVNEVVPADQLIATAERWANEICENAPIAVRATKQAALKGLDLPLEAAINGSYFWTERMRTSEDSVEGPKAFAEKRKPVWKGR
ncbi:MAG: enoyl-CoA hydratase [Dehalococcoidia bacterium]|nr:enoyl-CoA hydratase [Dehalococcoidia bacterium]